MKEREAAGNVSMDTIEGDESHSRTPYREVFCLITKVTSGICLINLKIFLYAFDMFLIWIHLYVL